MYNIKGTTTVILSILLISCGGELTEDTKENNYENDFVLSQTDSLLKVVDREFEIIAHDNELHHNEFINLQNTVSEYEQTLNQDKLIQRELTNRIESLIDLNNKKDSINNVLNSKIETTEYKISKLEETIKYNRLQFNEEVAQYQAEIFRMEKELKNHLEIISEMETFISNNSRLNKKRSNE